MGCCFNVNQKFYMSVPSRESMRAFVFPLLARESLGNHYNGKTQVYFLHIVVEGNEPNGQRKSTSTCHYT